MVSWTYIFPSSWWITTFLFVDNIHYLQSSEDATSLPLSGGSVSLEVWGHSTFLLAAPSPAKLIWIFVGRRVWPDQGHKHLKSSIFPKARSRTRTSSKSGTSSLAAWRRGPVCLDVSGSHIGRRAYATVKLLSEEGMRWPPTSWSWSGRVVAILAEPPCRSVSRLRHTMPGPPSTRWGVTRFGRDDLSDGLRSVVQGDTVLSMRLWKRLQESKTWAEWAPWLKKSFVCRFCARIARLTMEQWRRLIYQIVCHIERNAKLAFRTLAVGRCTSVSVTVGRKFWLWIMLLESTKVGRRQGRPDTWSAIPVTKGGASLLQPEVIPLGSHRPASLRNGKRRSSWKMMWAFGSWPSWRWLMEGVLPRCFRRSRRSMRDWGAWDYLWWDFTATEQLRWHLLQWEAGARSGASTGRSQMVTLRSWTEGQRQRVVTCLEPRGISWQPNMHLNNVYNWRRWRCLAGSFSLLGQKAMPKSNTERTVTVSGKDFEWKSRFWDQDASMASGLVSGGYYVRSNDGKFFRTADVKICQDLEAPERELPELGDAEEARDLVDYGVPKSSWHCSPSV